MGWQFDWARLNGFFELVWAHFVRQLGFLHNWVPNQQNRASFQCINAFQASGSCLLMAHWSKQVTEPNLISRMEKETLPLDGSCSQDNCKGKDTEEWKGFVAILQSTKPL